MHRVLILGLLTCPSGLANARGPDDGIAFFESRIRPVLIDKCYGCHSARASKIKGGLRLDDREATLKGGDSGPAVVPGKPDESLLLEAIAGTGGLSRMPPKETLPDDVIADFRRWIERGAADPRAPGGEKGAQARPVAGQGSDRALPPGTRDGSWWSLRPVASPRFRRLGGAGGDWVRTPIDAFILAKLKEKGLKPCARGRPADADPAPVVRPASACRRRRRRWTPSSPIASPDAYERLVDRLLASPHYGERWARHWMDVVHFAETHGHDQDRLRPNAWPYRDYLIDSFNEDKPYARFVEEQIAGDVLFPDDPEADRRARLPRGRAVGRELAPRHPRGHHRPPDRPLPRPRRHGHDRHVHLRQHDRPLRPLPRPQVRPDLAGGLLRPAGRLRRRRSGRSALRSRPAGRPTSQARSRRGSSP